MIIKTKRRAKVSRKRRRNPAGNKHRLTVYRTRKGWKGSEKGYLTSGTRINPRRRKARKARRVSYRTRRNPATALRRTFTPAAMIHAASIGLGIALGFLGMPMVYKALPAELAAKNRRFLGIIHVILGGMMGGMLKDKNLKTIGFAIAGTGAYDLIASNLPLGLAPIPEFSAAGSAVGASYMPIGASYDAISRPISPVAAIGVGASYEAPGMYTEGLNGSDLSVYDAVGVF